MATDPAGRHRLDFLPGPLWDAQLAILAPFASSGPVQPPQEAGQTAPEIPEISDPETPERELQPASSYASLEAMEEDFENERIEAALLERAQLIENCTVTWYTSGTCGKRPGDSTYGITASGLPVREHLTCATDPSVIPMYSEVFVQYADGTMEQLWATDTGVRGNHLDIYIEDYDAAIQNGRQTLKVWFVPPEEE